MDIGPEGVRTETQIDTVLHIMIGETPSGQFTAGVDFRTTPLLVPTIALDFGCATAYTDSKSV